MALRRGEWNDDKQDYDYFDDEPSGSPPLPQVGQGPQVGQAGSLRPPQFGPSTTQVGQNPQLPQAGQTPSLPQVGQATPPQFELPPNGDPETLPGPINTDPFPPWGGEHNGPGIEATQPGSQNSPSGPSSQSSAPSPTYLSPNIPSPSAPTTPGGPPALTQQYKAAIAKLLGMPLDINAEELAATPENRAYRLSAQRAQERRLADNAERASAEGWDSSGGFDTETAGIKQQRGEGEAAFLGQLAVTKMQQNRDMLVQGIQFAMSDGQFDKEQQLRERLAAVDSALRQAQLRESARQFDYGLGFDYAQLGVNANRDATQGMF